MKNKRTRYGLKLFILACSNSGYAHTLKLEEGLRPGESSRVGYGPLYIRRNSRQRAGGSGEAGERIDVVCGQLVHLGGVGAAAEGEEHFPGRDYAGGQEDVAARRVEVQGRRTETDRGPWRPRRQQASPV